MASPVWELGVWWVTAKLCSIPSSEVRAFRSEGQRSAEQQAMSLDVDSPTTMIVSWTAFFACFRPLDAREYDMASWDHQVMLGKDEVQIVRARIECWFAS